MKKIILGLCLVAACFTTQAQIKYKQTANWAFGKNVGISWNGTLRSSQVVGLGGGATGTTTLNNFPNTFNTSISTLEGCFSLSDDNGNLLFYSDGMKIWNKNNVVMPNGSGMLGDNSAAQSGIIFPYPGNSTKFVAVSIGVSNGAAYSVVDMSLNGGLGDVVSNQKNILLTGASGSTSESITSVQIPGTNDYWIIALSRAISASYLNAWKFTSSGITGAPVISKMANYVIPTGSNGYLKISPDNKHFGLTTFIDQRFFYGDFDITTGQFSNFKVDANPGSYAYGLEFSPDQKLVYVAGPNSIKVYNANDLFTLPNLTGVSVKIYSNVRPGIAPTYPGALQLAPDGRIYWGASGTSYLSFIDNPNDFNSPMIYNTAASFLPAGMTGQMGLPSFAANWFNVKTTIKPFACTGYDFSYSIDPSYSGTQPVRFDWNFGDGSAIVSQPVVTGTTTYTQKHTYATAGKYTTIVTPYDVNNNALSPVTLPEANIVDCVIKSNKMIRVNLPNSAEQQLNN